jgi:hypothetical protein
VPQQLPATVEMMPVIAFQQATRFPFDRNASLNPKQGDPELRQTL